MPLLFTHLETKIQFTIYKREHTHATTSMENILKPLLILYYPVWPRSLPLPGCCHLSSTGRETSLFHLIGILVLTRTFFPSLPFLASFISPPQPFIYQEDNFLVTSQFWQFIELFIFFTAFPSRTKCHFLSVLFRKSWGTIAISKIVRYFKEKIWPFFSLEFVLGIITLVGCIDTVPFLIYCHPPLSYPKPFSKTREIILGSHFLSLLKWHILQFFKKMAFGAS